MAYTTIDDPSAYFQTTLYTGNGGTNAITNTGNSDLQPDWLWLKKRNSSANHFLFDAVRGASKEINCNNNEAEASPANYLSSFNSDGFTIGSDSDINGSSDTFVAWQWKANGSGSLNEVGSIDSTVSANTTAGFSIVKWTGNGSAGATVGHGLGVVPAMIILKITNATGDWLVYHNKNTSDPQTEFLRLSTTAATQDELTIWNDTAPTSSVFSLGSESTVNGNSNTFIAYCFADVKGYSKFGSYTGNGNANGTFVYTGFKPAFVLWKRTEDAGYDWDLYDTARDTHNVAFKELIPNSSAAESSSTVLSLDILSNGFKLRTSNGNGNDSGKPYIYMAFAENPFVTSTGVPACAR